MQKNLLEYLEQTALCRPDAPAVTDDKGSVTFAQLLEQSRRVGTVLARQTAAYNRPMMVVTGRNLQSVVGYMSVLCSGNYYVPVDRKMPAARMESIFDQLHPVAVVFPEGDRAVAEQFAGRTELVCLQQAAREEIDEAILKAQRRRILDVDPAYIIFTSGSTGSPKGIVVSHRSVIDFTDWYVQTCSITGEDVLGNQAPFFFDLSVKDLYSTMKTGASMHILPQKFFGFPILLMRYLKENRITTLSWATSAFHLIVNSGVLEKCVPDSVRRVILGGEALQAKQLNICRRVLPKCRFINLYGPTEVTVDCCYYIIDREFADTEPIPIGKACENMEVFLLDEEGNPVPPGQPGELCVRGSGLAQGYFGDWDKTGKVFTQDPRNPWYTDRIYHTGDMAVEDPEGNFIFLARKDNQIKHGGYRIELGEIETVLNGQPRIQAAICFFDPKKDKIHCVYQGDMDVNSLAQALWGLLPKYMIPNVYHQVRRMPYNSNGKIDRVELKKEFLNDEG